MNRIQFSRYLAIGFTAFAVEYLLFTFFVYLGFLLLLAQTLSFCAGLVISFLGNRTVTFKAGEYTYSRSAQLWRYASLALFNLALSNLLIYLLVESLGVPELISKMIVMAAIVIWNYVIFSRFIFRRK